MTTFLYARVSTQSQVMNGESLETQREQLVNYAKKQKLKDLKFVNEEGVSAAKQKTKNRAKWSAMYAELAPGDVIVATKLDRLFRSVADAAVTIAALQKKEVALHLVDKDGIVAGSINDCLSFQIVAAVAEYDSKLKSERIREVKQSMRKRGLWIGGLKEKGFAKRKTSDGSVVAIVDEAEKVVLEKCVFWMRKRDEERAKGKLERAQKWTAAALRKELVKLADAFRETDLTKKRSSALQLQMNYKRKITTTDVAKIERIKKQKQGAFTEADLVLNVEKFSVPTLTRLMNKKYKNNAIHRLERMKEIERKNLIVDGVVVRAKKRGAGGRVRQKSLDL